MAEDFLRYGDFRALREDEERDLLSRALDAAGSADREADSALQEMLRATEARTQRLGGPGPTLRSTRPVTYQQFLDAAAASRGAFEALRQRQAGDAWSRQARTDSGVQEAVDSFRPTDWQARAKQGEADIYGRAAARQQQQREEQTRLQRERLAQEAWERQRGEFSRTWRLGNVQGGSANGLNNLDALEADFQSGRVSPDEYMRRRKEADLMSWESSNPRPKPGGR